MLQTILGYLLNNPKLLLYMNAFLHTFVMSIDFQTPKKYTNYSI